MTMLPAGWYPDPQTPDQMRYWDGAQWTLAQAPHPQAHHTHHQPDATIPMPVYASDRSGYGVPAPWTPAAHAPAPAAWYLRKPVLGVAAAVALLAVGSALGGETDSGQDDTAPRQAAADVAAPAEVQEEPAQAAAEEPAERPAEKPAEQPAPKAEKPAGTQGQVGTEPASADGSFTLPDETGKSLQAAQDDVQAVSGNPFYVTFSEDASGDGRMQILDSGWQVCSQSPVAGSAADEASIITFFVVRESETCP